jgi:universal stress protein A
MNTKKILFPTDFSHNNDAALEYASTLAADSKATLYVVHVDEQTDLNAAFGEASYYYVSTSDSETHKVLQERLEQVKPTVESVKCVRRCLTGSPAVELLRFAEQESIDLIVMASHGRTGLSRLLMGSVAEAVVRRASCPVLIVKQPVVPAADKPDICSYIAPT